MNTDVFPVLLLGVFIFALGAGVGMAMLVSRWRGRRGEGAEVDLENLFEDTVSTRAAFFPRPTRWLAIRSRDPHAVEAALALHNAQPCRWLEGLADERKLFIAPPVSGWILVFGSGLPDPADDVDDCYQFLVNLSRKLGQVQFFQADSALNHHAWARIEVGRVVRAYAWADRTLWHQGVKTRAEQDLGVKCFNYFEAPERTFLDRPDFITMNTEKVSLLAARWSLDPSAIDERTLERALGIAGEL